MMCQIIPLVAMVSWEATTAKPLAGTERLAGLTRAVQVTVVVIDQQGRRVGGLTEADFTVSDNRVAQEIVQCREVVARPIVGRSSNDGPIPSRILLAFAPMNMAARARAMADANRFVAALSRVPSVEVALVDGPRTVWPATSNLKAVEAALELSATSHPSLPSRDVVDGSWSSTTVDALSKMVSYPGSKAVLYFLEADVHGDGDRLLAAARNADVAVYPVFLLNPPVAVPLGDAAAEPDVAAWSNTQPTDNIPMASFGALASSEAADWSRQATLLERLATATGGRLITSNSASMVHEIVSSEGMYVLTYNLAAEMADGRFHPVEVRVRGRGLTVRSQNGYLAPTTR